MTAEQRFLLQSTWETEERYAFSGWDFSHLDGRWEEEPLPWNLEEIVRKALHPDLELLDMGTGGGEFLLTLGHTYARTTVTEGWTPNAALCRRRLAPLGIRVTEADGGDPLPFHDAAFDLVHNRHESYCLEEVRRILKPGGRFLTQQVGGENNNSLSRRVISGFVPQFPGFCLAREVERASALGFRVVRAAECFPALRFFDVGALAYYAKIIEWEFPGFSVAGCLEALCSLQADLERDGAIESREHRILLELIKE